MIMYLPSTPNPSGAYPAPRSNPEPGAWPLTDEQVQTVVAYNGFVTVTETEGGVEIVPDTEAWEAWKAENPPPPEPVPTVEERVDALEQNKAEQADVDALAAAIERGLSL